MAASEERAPTYARSLSTESLAFAEAAVVFNVADLSSLDKPTSFDTV
jgi:hypothetical protein